MATLPIFGYTTTFSTQASALSARVRTETSEGRTLPIEQNANAPGHLVLDWYEASHYFFAVAKAEDWASSDSSQATVSSSGVSGATSDTPDAGSLA